MSGVENSRLLEETVAAFNARDLDRWQDYYTDDTVVRNTLTPEPVQGKDQFRQQTEELLAAFPNGQIEVTNVVSSGNQVALETEFRGTNTGPLNNPGMPTVPATGREVRIPGGAFATIRDGKIAELRQYADALGMMTQLGLMEGAPESD